jgi:hypothetical protein
MIIQMNELHNIGIHDIYHPIRKCDVRVGFICQVDKIFQFHKFESCSSGSFKFLP